MTACSSPDQADLLAQFVADGEPAAHPYAALRAHLVGCPQCRGHAARLLIVHRALLAWPMATPPVALSARIAALLTKEQRDLQAWRPLPWSVWVPASSVLISLLMVLLALPGQIVPADAGGQIGAAAVQWPLSVAAWGTRVQEGLSPDALAALWTGMFVSLGGVGIALALRAWGEPHDRQVSHLRQTVSDAADRLARFARRA